jgi:hypothetical protein
VTPIVWLTNKNSCPLRWISSIDYKDSEEVVPIHFIASPCISYALSSFPLSFARQPPLQPLSLMAVGLERKMSKLPSRYIMNDPSQMMLPLGSLSG